MKDLSEQSLKLEQLPIEGIQLKEGVIKTAEGYIRIPKSKLKKNKPQESIQKQSDANEVKPQQSIKNTLPSRYESSYKKAVFSTSLGDVSGKYYPVIDCGSYIVLGLSDQSFIPKPYKEAPDLRLEFSCDSIKEQVVYTGCRFKDPDYDREYLILMKVEKNA